MNIDEIKARVAKITNANEWGGAFDQKDARDRIASVSRDFIKGEAEELEVAAALVLAVQTLDAIHRHTTHTEMQIRDLMQASRQVVLSKETK